MPSTKEATLDMLSDDLKEVLDSRVYAFPKKPFDGAYTGPGGPSLESSQASSQPRSRWLLTLGAIFVML